MSKIISIFKKIFTILAILLVLLVLFVAFVMWYEAYDIIGLELYKDEPIKEIIPYNDNIYVITDEGSVYVAGHCEQSTYRKYRNSEFYSNDKLGISAPVKIYDGKITKIVPYMNMHALLITEDGSLIDFSDFEFKKISNNAIYAIKPHRYNNSLEEFGEQHAEIFWGDAEEDIYYIIDENYVLYASNGKEKIKELALDVVQVDFYTDTLFVLSKNGDLNQYYISNDGTLSHKEKVFENVKAFDVEYTALRFDGTKLLVDDEVGKQTPLINVLTNDDELYVIGAYNLLCCTRAFSAHPEPRIIDEWTLIAEDVESFSLAQMGTAIKFKNNTAGYYGFDTDNSYNSEFKFGYMDLELENVINVYASDVQVAVQTEEAFYAWGYSLIYDSRENNNLFDGTPIVITP